MSDDRIYQQLDRIEERLNSIDIKLAKYNTELEYHIQRNDNFEIYLSEMNEQLKPIERHVERVKGILAFVITMSTLAAGFGAMAWIWGK